MPFDPDLANRLSKILAKRSGMAETRMFGGFGYLLNGNMCCGIHKNAFMLRLGVERFDQFSSKMASLSPMDFTGKVMKGWGMIQGAQCSDSELKALVLGAADYVGSLPRKQARTAPARKR